MYVPPRFDEPAVLTVSTRLSPSTALPTIDVAVVARVDTAHDVGPDARSPGIGSMGAEPTRIVVSVASAQAAPDQPGPVPNDIKIKISELKGARLRYLLASSGALSGIEFTLPAAAYPGLRDVLGLLAEVISMETVPLPPTPVGPGATWLVVDRSAPVGITVLRYRRVHLDRVEQGRAFAVLGATMQRARGSARARSERTCVGSTRAVT